MAAFGHDTIAGRTALAQHYFVQLAHFAVSLLVGDATHRARLGSALLSEGARQCREGVRLRLQLAAGE
jgi:hypothetical protein